MQARYFDGKTAAARPVELIREDQDWVLRGTAFELRWPRQHVHISERLGNTPRLLTFSGGGHCEVTDHAALERLLDGEKRSVLDKMQHSLLWALFAAALFVLSMLAAYRYLLPWGAEVVSMRIPGPVLQRMGSSSLETLDQFMLKPSELAPARQKALSNAYARLRPLPDASLQYRIVFRSSQQMGANAFALPDGNIVMLDEMVKLAANDNELIAVLAHERGHIERRHAMRMVLQSSAVGLVLAWYVGDVSSLLATVPAVVAQAKYSRDMEREADDYAERTLKFNGLPPCLLASVLQKAAHPPEAPSTRSDYLASHPATAERTARCPSK